MTHILAFFQLMQSKWQVWRWKRRLLLNYHQQQYASLFSDTNGFQLSKKSRLRYDCIDYVYGEIEFFSFIALIGLTNPSEKTVFYDLGSGVGTAIFASAMVFDFNHYCGIEILPDLHDRASDLKQELQKNLAYREKAKLISFKCADFLKSELSDGTLFFVNASAYFGQTWESLSLHLTCIAPGAIVISTSKKLQAPGFMVVKKTQVQMSFGIVDAFIQVREEGLGQF